MLEYPDLSSQTNKANLIKPLKFLSEFERNRSVERNKVKVNIQNKLKEICQTSTSICIQSEYD